MQEECIVKESELLVFFACPTQEKEQHLKWVYVLTHFPQPNGFVERCKEASHS